MKKFIIPSIGFILIIGIVVQSLKDQDIKNHQEVVKAEAEAKAKEEARKKAEAEAKAKEEARKKAEAEAKAKEEARKKAEAEAKAKEEARKKAEAEAKAKEEAMKKAEVERERRRAEDKMRNKCLDQYKELEKRFQNATSVWDDEDEIIDIQAEAKKLLYKCTDSATELKKLIQKCDKEL